MNELHNDFDNLFRQRFDDFQKDPPENVWNKIHTGLKTSGRGNFSHPIPSSLGYLIYPTLSLVILVIGSLYFINTKDRGNTFKTLSIYNESSLKESELRLADLTTDQKTTIKNNNSIPVKTDQSNTIQNDEKNTYNTTSEFNNKEINSQPLAENQTMIPDIFQPVNHEEAYTLSQIDQVYELNPVIAETGLKQNPDNKTDFVPVENQNQLTVPIHDDNILQSNNQTSKDTTIKTDLTQVPGNPDPQHDYGKNSNIYLGLRFIPDLGFDNFTGKPHMAYGAELSLGYQYKHFTIQTGAGLMFDKGTGNYIADYKTWEATDQYQLVTNFVVDTIPVFQNDSLIGYIYRPTFHTTTVEIFDSVGKKEDLNSEIRYTTLNIPLTIGYTWNIKKWGLSLKGGGVYTLMLGKKESQVQINDPEAIVNSIERKNPLRARQQWSLILSPSVDYYLTHDFSVGIEPYFRYTFQSGISNEKTYGLKPYAFGLKAGITYNF